MGILLIGILGTNLLIAGILLRGSLGRNLLTGNLLGASILLTGILLGIIIRFLNIPKRGRGLTLERITSISLNRGLRYILGLLMTRRSVGRTIGRYRRIGLRIFRGGKIDGLLPLFISISSGPPVGGTLAASKLSCTIGGSAGDEIGAVIDGKTGGKIEESGT